MAKIVVAGNTASVQMGIDAQVVEKVQKWVPKAMKLVNEDGGVDFIVKVGDKAEGDSIGTYGFTSKTVAQSINKYVFSVFIPNDVTDAKEYVQNNFGAAIVKLNKVEDQISSVIDEAVENEREVTKSIVIAE